MRLFATGHAFQAVPARAVIYRTAASGRVSARDGVWDQYRAMQRRAAELLAT